MRKLLSLTLMFLVVLPALANDNEAKIKAAVEDRYKEWIAAANKKDAAALTNLYDENAVLMPKEEEPVIGKAAIGEYYKKLVADPHFVPFTLTLNWNSFHVVGDIAIATSVFEGDVTRNGKQIHSAARTCLSGRNRQTVRGRFFVTCSTRFQRKNNYGSQGANFTAGDREL
jgi:ketosteroid isomerase-like protein